MIKKLKKASPQRIKTQVLSLRPNAKCVVGGIGYIVIDGDSNLNAEGGGYVSTESEAWRHAFDYLLRQQRGSAARAVQAMAGHTFGANLDRLELEDLPAYDTLCVLCDGSGVIRRRVTVYEHGCGFPHDDTEESPCPKCDGTGDCAAFGRKPWSE
jgi:hypothetical protein